MKVGINTAVYEDQVHAGASQLDCLKTLATRQDISAIEVRGEFFDPKTKEQELASIQTLCQTKGWDFYYSVPEELFGAAGINESLPVNLAMASKYQLKGLKYSFGVVPEISDTEVAALNTLLKGSDVKVTIENQPNQNGTLTTFKAALAWIQAHQLTLGYTFDAGNWYWINQQPEVAFDELKNAITIFHLKDIKDQMTVMLGTGDTDWQRLVQALPAEMPLFLEYGISAQQLPGQIELVKQALS